jgi:cysteinyl-tRNA synthetase
MLGNSFDIHAGGADLQFPHHENEIAQSEGATGQQFAQFWMHNGFINIDNEKMSKSLGNFFTLRDVLKSFDAETVRFYLVRSHYRTSLNYSDQNLNDARSGLKRLYTALQAVVPSNVQIDWANPYAARFKAAMDEDFATPEAVAVLFELEGGALEGGLGADEGEAFAFEEFGGAGLAAAFDQLGFVVEEIDVGRRAVLEKVDDAFGLGGECLCG